MQLTGDIIVFEACTALTSLNLCYCKKLIGDVIVFQACTALTSLKLGYCEKLIGFRSKLLEALPTLKAAHEKTKDLKEGNDNKAFVTYGSGVSE